MKEGWHVDASPLVVGDRVYAASGYLRNEVFCLDRETGRRLWVEAIDLPAFAPPVAAGDRVIFGIGSGDLASSGDPPAGALLCVDGATGRLLWRWDVGDGVHRQPVVDDQHVYCATRDAHCYGVRLADGALVWKTNLEGPVAAAPALAPASQYGQRAGLYVVTNDGILYCLDPDSGRTRWTFDVAAHAHRETNLLSSPVVVAEPTEAGMRRRICFGAELKNALFSTPAVYCLEARD
jgi:outer membrane protein assembly factor BamB